MEEIESYSSFFVEKKKRTLHVESRGKDQSSSIKPEKHGGFSMLNY